MHITRKLVTVYKAARAETLYIAKNLSSSLTTLSFLSPMRGITIYVCMWIFIIDKAVSHVSINLFDDCLRLYQRNYYPYFTNNVNEVMGR